jgi:CheY-like chemotaxis protein
MDEQMPQHPTEPRQSISWDAHMDSHTRRHIMKVMVVDQTPDGQKIQDFMVSQDYLVLHEKTGQQALELFEKFRPDLVMLDINLPDFKSWALLDAIKEAKQHHQRLSIVVMYPFLDPASRLYGKLKGVTAYLVKPFTDQTLMALIQEVMGTRNAKGW